MPTIVSVVATVRERREREKERKKSYIMFAAVGAVNLANCYTWVYDDGCYCCCSCAVRSAVNVSTLKNS